MIEGIEVRTMLHGKGGKVRVGRQVAARPGSNKEHAQNMSVLWTWLEN